MLDWSSIEVPEDAGTVMVCLKTGDAICLSVHSQGNEAGNYYDSIVAIYSFIDGLQFLYFSMVEST